MIRLDTPAALITKATDVLGRILRVAARVRPTLCLQLMGELALTEGELEKIERLVAMDAQFAALADMKPKRALPPSPVFKGARGFRALPAPRCASPKRLKAGRAP